MVFEDGQTTAQFNYGISYLQRINMLFYLADAAAIRLDVYNWFNVLMAIRRELYHRITHKEPKQKKGSEEMTKPEFKEIEKIIPGLVQEFDSMAESREAGNNPVIRFSLYNKLDAFELALRLGMKQAGLEMRDEDDASQALMRS